MAMIFRGRLFGIKHVCLQQPQIFHHFDLMGMKLQIIIIHFFVETPPAAAAAKNGREGN